MNDINKNIVMVGGGFLSYNLSNYFASKGYCVTYISRKIANFTNKNIIQVITKHNDINEYSNHLNNSYITFYFLCDCCPSKFEMSSYERNILWLVNLLYYLKNNTRSKLVFISSGGTIYGNNYHSPINENSPTNPICHYGVLKLMQEKIINMYNEKYGMKNIILRISNPYGPGQDISNGVGAVSNFLLKSIRDELITIYGTGDDIVRDYIYIDDVCKMIFELIHNITNECKNRIINVGTGIGHTLNDIVSIVEKVTTKKVAIKYLNNRDADVKYNVLDINYMSSFITNFKVLNLSQGIKKYYETINSLHFNI